MIYSRLILPFLQFYIYDFPEKKCHLGMAGQSRQATTRGRVQPLRHGPGTVLYIYMIHIYIEIIDTSIHDMIYVVIYI